MGSQNLPDSFAFGNAHFNLMKDRQGAEKTQRRCVMLRVQQHICMTFSPFRFLSD